MRKGCPFGMKLGNLIGKPVHRCTHAHVGKAIGLSGTHSEAQLVAMVIKKHIGVSKTRCGGRSLYP